MIELIASTPLARIITLAVLFAIVVGLAMVALTVLGRRANIRGELQTIASIGGAKASDGLTARRTDAWVQLVNRIEKMGLNLGDTRADALRDRLKAAGFDSPAAPRVYNLIRLALVVMLPTLFVLLSIAGGRELSFVRLYVFGSIAALFGLFVPALFIRAKADRRREDLVNGFPDCLDLMLVCVEAGLGLEAALDRVGREMTLAHPGVAKVMTTATLRLRAGATREDALRNMADEAGVDEIRSFATLLIQSDKLGTSIATTFMIYAAEMRERRRMRAEEKAHRLPARSR
jgi:tight adherence protein C